MRWIKIWIDELLTGTTLKELDSEEFRVWILLLCYAGKSKNNPGIVEKFDGVPYKIETLADLMNCEVERFKKILAKLEKVEKIKMLPDGRIEIINFKKYQTTYERYYKEKRREAKLKKEQESVSASQIENLYSSKIEEEFKNFDAYTRKLILKTIKVLPLTRQTGTISPALIDKFLESLKEYSPEIVKAGLSKYLDKKMYAEGKKENYLLGILKELENQKEIKKRAIEKSEKEEKKIGWS
jgi:hypothetical protein